jgi:hypothetical protein
VLNLEREEKERRLFNGLIWRVCSASDGVRLLRRCLAGKVGSDWLSALIVL